MTMTRNPSKTENAETDRSIARPRTQPPTDTLDPHERFAGHIEDARCPRCGSEQVDGWMTEGATHLLLKCADCSNISDPREE